MRALRKFAKGFVHNFSRPEMRDTWGGPFNGQEVRQRVFTELSHLLAFDFAVETGTYRGDTTAFIAGRINGPTYTIEKVPRSFGFVLARHLSDFRIRARFGDSRAWLERLLGRGRRRSSVAFFYLDAHWERDLPLEEEIDLIFSFVDQAVVMIDDFRVPDDDGYGFDDYGPGKVIDLDYLKDVIERHRLAAFVPSSRSDEETGARRGAAVLVRQELAPGLHSMSSLRLCPGQQGGAGRADHRN